MLNIGTDYGQVLIRTECALVQATGFTMRVYLLLNSPKNGIVAPSFDARVVAI